MGHFAEIDLHDSISPVSGYGWESRDPKTEYEPRVGIRYRKTRSTLAFAAADMSEFKDLEIADTLKALLRLSKLLNREEVVIEDLEMLERNGKTCSIRACFDAIQSDITRVSRQMNLYPPRVALEKRGEKFDLRIYPVFH